MIRKLQKKFIFITMISLLIITSALIIAINVTNLVRIDGRAEDLMDMITLRREPEDVFRPDSDRGEGKPQPPRPEGEGAHDAPWFSGKHGDFKSISITPETEFTTRWFSVSFSDGALLSVSVEKIASVTSEQAVAYAKEVLSSGDLSGYEDGYKYRLVSENNTETVYFLNCETELQNGFFMLIATVLIGITCLVFLFLLITVLSRRAVKPVLENMERQKRFITDAGHELKTPLSIISANADVLSLTGENNEWVESIRKQTDRMGHLVQDLLTLAKGEESDEVVFQAFHLSDAVIDTAMPFAVPAESRGKKVELDIQPDLELWGDEGAIRHLISILMENALKYADEGGTISLSLRREGKHIVLLQKNPCTPLPTREQMDRLFDRFYRVDPSRSRESGGYGIGLSIAKIIVESHKGKISAYAEDNQLCFSVIF
ncbi:MAG: GHKL domain-containing protein [Clostridia bacterium]|nr:GHKL domain-containing protein [Clostridia bacterium]